MRQVSKHRKKAKVEIVNAIFSELEKDIKNDLSSTPNGKDKFCIALCDIIINEKVYRNAALTRNDLMKRMNIGKYLFIKRFQYCFGMPFRECVNKFRMKEAIVLLEYSDLSIEEIANKVGFGTVRTFQRLFLTMYQTTPKGYRKAIIR